MGIPTIFKNTEIYKNLQCHSGRQWRIKEGLVGIKTISMILLTKYFSPCNLAYVMQAFISLLCIITVHSRSNHHKRKRTLVLD